MTAEAHRRRWLVAALFGVAVVVAACAPMPLFGDPWGGLDPDAVNIVPKAGPDAATIATSAPADSNPPGVEGSVLFIRLIASDGARVLDRPFVWPSDEQSVPPGEYTLSAYWRGCNGWCGNLTAESAPMCQDEIGLGAHARVVVHVIPRELAPGSECSIDVVDPGQAS